jgi:hypothetical protein
MRLTAGYSRLARLAVVSNNSFLDPELAQVYWTGVRYSALPGLDLTAAY